MTKIFAFIKLHLKKFVVSSIIILIAISMIPWVISEYVMQNQVQNSNTWLKVGGIETTPRLIFAEYNSLVNQNQALISQNPFILQSIINRIIQQHISSSLFANEAKSLKMTANNELLFKIIASVPYFKNEDGTFNRERFEQQVSTVFGSESLYLDNLRNDVIREQLLSTILNVLYIPKDIAILNLQALNQNRTFHYTQILRESIKDLKKPTDTNLLQIRDANKESFTQLETRSVELLTLNIDPLLTKIKVTKSELEDYYNKHKNNYLEEEQREVSQILVSNLDKANKIFNEIKNTKLEDITSKYDIIKLGKISKEDLPPNISSIAFNVGAEQFQEPIETPVGWHILYVNKILTASPLSLEEVKTQITQIIEANKQAEFKDNLKNDFTNIILLNNVSLKDATTTLKGAKFTTLSSINSLNQDQNHKYLKGITENPKVLKTIFASSKNQTPTVIDTDSNILLAIKITNITPQFIKDIKDIKPELMLIWNKQQLDEQVNTLSSKLILDLSKDYKKVKLPRNINITRANQTFDADTLNTIYTTKKYTPIKGQLKDGTVIVGIVTNIRTPKITMFNKNQTQNQEALNFMAKNLQEYKEDLLFGYYDLLTKKFNIHINQEVMLNALLGNNNLGQQ